MLALVAGLTVRLSHRITADRFAKAWEPCWDARGFKTLEEMRRRDVQRL